jgi:hypothetical protein
MLAGKGIVLQNFPLFDGRCLPGRTVFSGCHFAFPRFDAVDFHSHRTSPFQYNLFASNFNTGTDWRNYTANIQSQLIHLQPLASPALWRMLM